MILVAGYETTKGRVRKEMACATVTERLVEVETAIALVRGINVKRSICKRVSESG